MSSRRRLARTACAGVFILLSIALAPTASAEDLAASLRLEQPARIDGALTYNGTHVAGDWLVQGNGQRVFEARHATIEIWEYWRADEVSGPLVGDVTDRLSSGPRSVPTVETFESNFTRLTALPQLLPGTWRGTSDGDRPASLELSAGCKLSWRPAVTDPGKPRPPWMAQQPLVQAECESTESTARGMQGFFVDNATVRLQDADGRDRIIRTGTRETDISRGLVNISASRTVLLAVYPTTPEALFRPGPGSNATIFAPHVAVAGRLSFPTNASGVLRWGAASFETGFAGLAPEGGFRAWPNGSQTLAFQGISTNRPKAQEAQGPFVLSLADATWFALASAGVLFLLWAILRSLGIAQFSRILTPIVLENPKRREIYEFVRRNPGALVQDIAQHLGGYYNGVLHHVRVLARNKQVTLRRFGRRSAVFAVGEVPRNRQVGAFLARTAAYVKLLELLKASPDASQTQLGIGLGLSQSRVHQMIQRMERCGIVESVKTGKRCQYLVKAPLPLAPATSVDESHEGSVPSPAA